MGFRVQGSGFWVLGSGFRVRGSGFMDQGSEIRVQGLGFGVPDPGFRVQGPATNQRSRKKLLERNCRRRNVLLAAFAYVLAFLVEPNEHTGPIDCFVRRVPRLLNILLCRTERTPSRAGGGG